MGSLPNTHVVNAEICRFPQLTDGVVASKERRMTAVPLGQSASALYTYCKFNKITLPTLLRAVWALVLGRYIGAKQIGFAALVSSYRRYRIVLCQAQLEDTVTISNLLEELETGFSGNRSFSIDSLEEFSQFTDSDGQRLFNTVVAFQDSIAPHNGEFSVEEDVLLSINASENNVDVTLKFATSVLSEAQAFNIASTFRKTISLVMDNSKTLVGEMDLISERDQDQIWSWNKEPPEVVNECAHEIIQRQVKSRPNAPAVFAWDDSFTYSELDELSTRLAHSLVAHGVGPEVIVPLCFEKSAWAIVGILGVIKAGGAMVFVDPSHPPARREEIIGQVGAAIVVTSPQQAALWESSDIKLVTVSRATIDELPSHDHYPISKVNPKNILYVIFTSGSTGKPKGCLIEHSSFCSGAIQQATKGNMGSSSRVLQLASYCFDVSILEILTALMSGACICTPNERSMVQGIASIITGMDVTWAFLTPSLVKLIGPQDIPNLKTLVLGGEALSRLDVETWADHLQLINGYGPSECSVAAVGNPGLTSTTDPANIGRAVGGICWIVDAQDYNRLVPIGAAGELLIEGPILARGYLNNPEKTTEVFIDRPAWGPKNHSGQPRRLYKTGDLARYNSDGSIQFIGRKDTQVKLRGQRIELGEIEHHISMHGLVRHAIVVLPKTGYCKQRLVAILSLKEFASHKAGDATIRMIQEAQKEAAASQVSAVREYLSALVPSYMVPTAWVVMEQLPLLISGKIARSQVAKWIVDVDEETYCKIVDVGLHAEGKVPLTPTEAKLRDVFSLVLNLPADRIKPTSSFLNLGGDSISAMQVISRCRAEGLAISVKDILRSKNISDLASCVVSAGESIYTKDETFDTPFDLSPVQRMYFEVADQVPVDADSTHFNQSFFLRLTRNVALQDLSHAIEAVVGQHSMLRARFGREDGRWTQRILKDIKNSYSFDVHALKSSEEVVPIIATRQSSLDIQNGPVFAADLFEVDGDGQLLFLVAHHVMIDLVSWRVIMRDLEEFLTQGKLLAEKSLPFQNWLGLQADYAKNHLIPSKVLPFDVPPPNYEYWGMAGKPNTLGDTLEERFTMDQNATSVLLGSACHTALRTEPIDLLLSALIHSFGQTFSDRAQPALFREGHGREPWDDEIDLSRTVGWFTTMYPLHVEMESGDDIIEIVRHTKDIRHSVPSNGWSYFASRFLNDEGIQAFGHHTQVEICFDYLGLYQQLERDDALLRQEPRIGHEAAGDVGQNVQRFALVEITAEVILGQLQLSFVYNRHMRHQASILRWISECHQSLQAAMQGLISMDVNYTLSDFPLLPLTYDGLEKLRNETLPRIGLSDLLKVEDIYPCSPMQQGLLLSQNKSRGFYEFAQTFEVLPSQSGNPIDSYRFQDAWQKVIQRHPALRTILVESVAQDGLYDQVVLKNVDARIVHVNCEKDEAEDLFNSQEPISFQETEALHRLTICESSSGQMVCKLEINHAIVDGISMPIILRDICLAYDGKISDRQGPLFSDYISYLQQSPVELDLIYWKDYLSGIEPCYFPPLEGSPEANQLRNVEVRLNVTLDCLNNFCGQHNVTLSNLFQTAWGLVLRCYTGLDQVCFGLLSSGRDAPVAGIEDAVGAFITMLVCRLNLTGTNPLIQVLERAREDLTCSLPHQYCSLANIQHALELSGQPLFNTVMSFHKEPDPESSETSALTFNTISGHDPTEYEFTVDVGVSGNQIDISLEYWTASISDAQASNVASCFSQAIHSILKNSKVEVNSLDLVGEAHRNQIQAWNAIVPTTVERCMHEIIQEKALAHPSAPAVCSWDGNLTYNELDMLATQLAQYLVGLGVKQESLVPFCFDKSSWTIVAMLAIAKAGGACVALDPTHPLSRLKSILYDTNARIVLVAPQHHHLFCNMVDHVVVVESSLMKKIPAVLTNTDGATAFATAVQPHDPAFVVFTSGTTGKPKGIVLKHSSICTNARDMGDILNLGPHSRVLQFAAYTFDVSISDIFLTLIRGGCVCVISESDKMNNLAGAINALQVNSIDLTSTVASLLQPVDVPAVKKMSLGGELLSKEVLKTWADQAELFNMYGPAECTITMACNPRLSINSNPATIGKQVGSLTWIVDPLDHNRLMPIGSVGELLVEGPLLARGYLNDPARTTAGFIECPQWLKNYSRSGQNGRLYKTGDLVRYNSDGTLNYVGRKDMQVKINGQRVELSEIEHHVQARLLPTRMKYHVVVEAVLTPRKRTRNSNKRTLAVFLHSSTDDDNDQAKTSQDLALPLSNNLRSELMDLQTSLADSLPSYMIPSIYIALSRMPINTSGKLDHNVLQRLVTDLSESQLKHYSLEDAAKRPPTSEMEKVLQSLWAKVLGIAEESIGADDSFFRLGGDSIGAMQLVVSARAINVALTAADIFRHSKLSTMAEVAVANKDTGNLGIKDELDVIEPFSLLKDVDSLDDLIEDAAVQCQITKDCIQDIYPCTPLQEALMTISTTRQQSAYIARKAFRLPLHFNIERFQKAWQDAVEMHTILRTRIIHTKDSGSLQVVLKEGIEWQVREEALQLHLKEDNETPMQYGRPLLRLAIVDDDEEREGNKSKCFVWTAHHAVYDGWSLPLLFEHVEAIYNSSSKAATTISFNPTPYNGFMKYLSSVDPVKTDTFWREQILSGESRPASFPELPSVTYQPRADQTEWHSMQVSPRASSTTATLTSTILRAAWAMVVAQYSNTNDVIFATTLSGRNAPVPGIMQMAGPTIATVPIRISLDPSQTVDGFLSAVESQAINMIPYEHAGLQNIRKLSIEVEGALDLKHLFVVQPAKSKDQAEFLGLETVPTDMAGFDTYALVLECSADDGTIEIEARYDRTVIPKETIRTMLHQMEHMIRLLSSSLTDTDMKLGDMEIINPRDLKQVSEWNEIRPEEFEAANTCIHKIFEKNAHDQPNNIAISSWDGELTYRELDVLATGLAYHLSSLGVKEEVMVPLCFEKSAFTIVSMLAVLKAGGAYVCLSPNHPMTRLKGILDDIDATVILVASQFSSMFQGTVPHIVTIEPQFLSNLPVPIPNISSSVRPENPAFVVFTSGSTGKPKGVIIEHRSFCTMAQAQGPSMQFDTNTRVLQFAAYTFDVSNSEVWTTLVHGGRVCIPSEFERLNDLAGVINRRNINWLFLTPTVANMLDPAAVPNLSTLALGGEAIRQDLVTKWASKSRLMNSYGPSESSIWTSNARLVPRISSANIGRGLGVSTWITDPFNYHRLSPIGCIGELLLEGPIVARGYVKNVEKTRAAFVNDPLWSRQGKSENKRFYRTGDLVKYNLDGTMDYVGRKDTQVKLRGQRIELGEIEHHIKISLSNTHQVAVDVILQKGQADKPLLAVFLDLNEPAQHDSEICVLPLSTASRTELVQLQASLIEHLPSYMVPTLYITLDKMPMTMSGKLYRARLRQMASELSEPQIAEYSLTDAIKRAPSTQAEIMLQKLWAEVLGIEKSTIGANDSFFRLGGDSISAMRLAAAAHEMDLSLTVADIFRYSRLCKMAEETVQGAISVGATLKPFSLLDSTSSLLNVIEKAAAQCDIRRELVEDVYPCTPFQEGLMAASLIQKGAYVAQNSFLLPKSLDIERFRQAWQTLVDMHPILRTRIVSLSSKSLQVVLRENKIVWESGASLDAYLKLSQAALIQYGGPLTRYAIIEGAANNRHFVWTAHHAVYDGWSVATLFKQLERLYEDGSVPKSVPYNGFIEYLSKVDATASDNYWRAQLSGEKPVSFPRLPSPAYQPHPDQLLLHTMEISRESATDILTSSILRAAWAIIVARYSDTNDVAFGVALSGRDSPVHGIENMVGPTISTVPMRMRLDLEQNVADYLVAVQNQTTEMISFQHAGLQNIRTLSEESQVATDLGHIFVVQPSTETGTPAEVLGLKSVTPDMANFDTYALVVECGLDSGTGKIKIEARFDSGVIPEKKLERMIGQFEHVARQLSTDRSTNLRLSEIEVLSEQDLKQILQWNSIQPTTVNECVHDLIERQVTSRPNSLAIRSWDGDFTYHQLDELSTRLAYHFSTACGVGPEVMVPFCFDKSAWAIIAMLAIIKSGGACVALNPDHPKDRLEDIIQDVGAKLVVSGPSYAYLFESLVPNVVVVEPSLLDKLPQTGSIDVTAGPRNPAFVVFTSGSTGKPKGIVLEHRAVCTSAREHGAAMRFDVDSRVLQFAAYTFDVSIGEIFTTLIHGGCICNPSEFERRNDLAGVINRLNVNWMYLTPSVANTLHPSAIPTLKTLSLGGEALTEDHVAVWAREVYLINIYGPAETTIWSTCLTGLQPDTPPSNIGRGIGGLMWITEISNHNRLCPIGCVGELLIEGPIVAREYLNLKEKTEAAFIENPAWLQGQDRRLYKTGDLVRYNTDGTIDYIGRRDNQIKLRGQRIELAEIEHHLSTHTQVRHSMIAFPKSGICKKRLVAVLSLHEFPLPRATSGTQVQLISTQQKDIAKLHLSTIRALLSDKVPEFMVPGVWIVVEAIPTTTSGKTNRLHMTKWIEEMTDDLYESAMSIQEEDGPELSATAMEENLQKILGGVLNVPVVKLNMSFLSLGGDSITAMQVIARCRAEGIALTVQDIMRSKTVSKLALCARPISQSLVSYDEVLDTPFDLSPIQKMYFEIAPSGSMQASHHFNQSFLLRLTQKIEKSQLARAIETLISRHSMLRARFQHGENGQWTQLITSDVTESYRFQAHDLRRREQVNQIVTVRQSSLNIADGPVFMADFFDIVGEQTLDEEPQQLLFVVAHHLVIDLVSWRVILHDLEELLTSGMLPIEKPLSFQAWCRLQAEHSQQLTPKAVLPIDVAPADFGYWGMAGRRNIHQDAVEKTMSLDVETTSKLFGISNEAFRTEPVDIILSGLIQSFNRLFYNRPAPTVFCEGHGRESWNDNIDLSGTVGWFTTMNPLHVQVGKEDDIFDILRKTKDLRHRVPGNGRPYFASRYLTEDGQQEFGKHSDMEIIFNYLGRYQQLERDGALFRPEESELSLDQGQSMPRMSLFEISAVVLHGKVQISFTYNRHMLYQDKISRWIRESQQSLKHMVEQLEHMELQHTLSDFPLLPLTYDGLQALDERLLKIGISPAEVEDIYPCVPMQQHMLFTQGLRPETYRVQNIYDVLPSQSSGVIDLQQLQSAWQKVVDRHPSLRTIFVPNGSQTSVDQVVLKHSTARVVCVQCNDEDISPDFYSQPPLNYEEPRPQHQLSIFQTSTGKVSCKIEITHALIDGLSVRLLMRDLALAYEGNDSPGPLYSSYVSYLQEQISTPAKDYWRSYLRGLEPCEMPSSTNGFDMLKEQRSIKVDFREPPAKLQAFCQKHNLTVANVFQTAWGLVLRNLTGLDQACFGYLTSGRDVPVNGIADAVGNFIHLLVCRIDVHETTEVTQLVQQTQADFLQSLPHQHGSIEVLQEMWKTSRQPLFNTIMSLQYITAQEEQPEESSISFEHVGGQDPNEYDMSVGVAISSEEIEVSLGYWNTSTTEEQAARVASLFVRTVSCILANPDKRVASLDLPIPSRSSSRSSSRSEKRVRFSEDEE